jgi:hypothetical protein
VVLVRLDTSEIITFTLRETILTVELKLANLNRVLAVATNTGLKENLRKEVRKRIRRGSCDNVARR